MAQYEQPREAHRAKAGAVEGEAVPTMRQKHREEHQTMKEFHEKRKAQETKDRADKMPRGLLGIWHLA